MRYWDLVDKTALYLSKVPLFIYAVEVDYDAMVLYETFKSGVEVRFFEGYTLIKDKTNYADTTHSFTLSVIDEAKYLVQEQGNG